MPTTRASYGKPIASTRVITNLRGSSTASSSAGPSAAPIDQYSDYDNDTAYHCSYKHFEECHDNVNGRGYARSAISIHIKDWHFSIDN
ncbi:hypothetical protein MKW92_037390, partial [Papaver armeniacum]